MRSRSLRLGALFLGATLVASACATPLDVTTESADAPGSGGVPGPDESGATPDEAPGGSDPEGDLDWGACPDTLPGVAVECSTLVVPLDHSDPDGDTIEIAVARADTASGDDQIGSLVFNPGGPGGSGVDFVEQLSLLIPAEVQQRFDLVGFDPRGVAASTAVECDVDVDDEIELLAEGDDQAWEDLVDEARSTPDLCTDDTLDLAPWIGTNNAARDLDLLREALGDDGLTFVGYSYGTRLGATYAALFPDRVRALVLDAAVAPDDDLATLDRAQAAGFDQALANFADACDADPDCPLREVGDTIDVITELRDEIAEVGSFTTDDPDRVLTPGELDLGIAAALYSVDAWPFLADGLALAEFEQDGTVLQVLGDQLAGREPDGTYDNSNVANFFINCADQGFRRDADEIREIADDIAAQSEIFGDFFRAETGCIGSPDPIDPLLLDPAVGAPPILVIGNTGDPATPYEWSVELADFLDSGVLYTVEGEGHTTYGTVDCVAEVVNRYLIDLELPGDDESCTDDAVADAFPPVGEGQLAVIVELLDCLRENGVDLPELTEADVLADPAGDSYLDAFDPTDPAFMDASLACIDEILAVEDSF